MRGEPSDGAPSAEASERRSPRLDGANGGERRKGAMGDEGPRLPVPVEPAVRTEDGATAAREDVGDVCAGREGSEGPASPPDSGECWRSDGEGEWKDGEPEETVADLKAFTGPMSGRVGKEPAGDDGSCKVIWSQNAEIRNAHQNHSRSLFRY